MAPAARCADATAYPRSPRRRRSRDLPRPRNRPRIGLRIDTLQSFGASYAETLREWRTRFTRAWPSIEPLGFDGRFRRMWEYYLSCCQAGFRGRTIDVSLLVLKDTRQPPAG